MLKFERLDAEGSAAVRREFRRSVITIGRSAGAVWQLDHRLVSGSHAELRWLDGAWMYKDCGSTNGSWRNGERVPARTAVGPLALDDVLSFGSPHFSWRLTNVPTQPDDFTRSPTVATVPSNASTAWPALCDVSVHVCEESSGGAEWLPWVALVLTHRDGQVARRVVLSRRSPRQRQLLARLAQALHSHRAGEGPGTIPRKVLAEQLGYQPSDKSFYGRLDDVRDHLLELGLHRELAAQWYESVGETANKKGGKAEALYRLRIGAVRLDRVPDD